MTACNNDQGLHTTPSFATVVPHPESFEEGDRCRWCLHWFWRDGHWHSLVPVTYADHPELARGVTCPSCEADR